MYTSAIKLITIYKKESVLKRQVVDQTANYVVRAEDLPRAVSGRTIVYCLKTMARRASPARTLQSYQSGLWKTCIYAQYYELCQSRYSQLK